MGDLTVKGLLFPMEDSLCKDCKFRMSRVLLPLDLEEFGLTEEELEEIGVDDDEKVVVENIDLYAKLQIENMTQI